MPRISDQGPISQEMLEYAGIRDLAKELSNRMPENHPCRKGNGACCEQRNITVTSGDAQVIRDAVLSGYISANTLSNAENSAKSPNDTYCPFFNKRSRECTIYPYRPLVCVSYGAGAMPAKVTYLQQAEEEAVITGKEATITHANCTSISACQSCIAIRDERGDRVPVRDMIENFAITQYLVRVHKTKILTRIDYFAGNLRKTIRNIEDSSQ